MWVSSRREREQILLCFCVCLHTAHGARRLPAVPTKPHGCSINQTNNQPPIRITEQFLAGRANSWRLTPCKSTMVKVEGETEKKRLRMYVVQHDRIRTVANDGQQANMAGSLLSRSLNLVSIQFYLPISLYFGRRSN